MSDPRDILTSAVAKLRAAAVAGEDLAAMVAEAIEKAGLRGRMTTLEGLRLFEALERRWPGKILKHVRN